MESMLYRFACPRCGTEVASDDSVVITESHTSGGALTRVRILAGSRLLHECEGSAQLLGAPAPTDTHLS
jgi:hypothetical protein